MSLITDMLVLEVTAENLATERYKRGQLWETPTRLSYESEGENDSLRLNVLKLREGRNGSNDRSFKEDQEHQM